MAMLLELLLIISTVLYSLQINYVPFLLENELTVVYMEELKA